MIVQTSSLFYPGSLGNITFPGKTVKSGVSDAKRCGKVCSNHKKSVPLQRQDAILDYPVNILF